MRFGHGGRYFRSLMNQELSYAATLEGRNGAWVVLHIQAGDNEVTKRIFDELHRQRSQIESEVLVDAESEWYWLRHDPYTFSSISVRRDGSINDPPEVHDEIRRWMLDLFKRFQEVFDPRVAAIHGREV